jgi:hypothetical protein
MLGRETSIKLVSNFASTIPDTKFEIREVLVAGDRGIVGGEVTGTPSGELFGVPHSGNSFRIMAVDIQTIRDGKIAKTYHMAEPDRSAPREVAATSRPPIAGFDAIYRRKAWLRRSPLASLGARLVSDRIDQRPQVHDRTPASRRPAGSHPL